MMKKKIFMLLIGVLCFLLPVFSACDQVSEKTVGVAPRFDGMNISEISPLTENAEVKGASAENTVRTFSAEDRDGEAPDRRPGHHKIDLPQDNMPEKDEPSVNISEEIVSELEKDHKIDVDEANASASFYAELNQDVFITISLINPDSYSILRFTLNGTVYQSYQFESGSSSTMLVLKVNSGNVCGIKEFTIDEMKYVDDSDGNAIKDVIIEGNRSVKLCVAYDKEPTVEVLNESMDYTSYSADFYVSDYYGLADYEGGLRLYLYDGVDKKKELNLKKGSNSVAFDNLIVGNAYKCVVVGLYDRYDIDGYRAHVLYEDEIKPSALNLFTEVGASYDKITFGYKIPDSTAEITDILLLDEGGEAIARTDGEVFENLFADTQYELRIYYTFKLEGEEYVFYDGCKIKTKAYPVPSVSATYAVRETAIDYDVHIDDDFDLLTLNAIKLYDQNGEFVASADVDAKTIEGLVRNKNYVLKFFYTYDLKDGKGAVEAEKEIAFSTSKAVPIVEIKPYLATEISLQFDLLVTDPNVVGRINSIRLYKKSGKVFVNELTNLALRSFSSLTPNTEYVIEVGYVYDMDDGNGSQLILYSEEMTTAKRVPSCEIGLVPTTDSITITVNENDPDNAGELVGLSVYDGDALVKEIEQISAVMTVDGLYSDRDYTVVGKYLYNVDDYSQSDMQKEIRSSVSTHAKSAPRITVSDSKITYSSFGYRVNIEDRFGICTLDQIKLLLGTVPVKQTDERNGNFDGLYSNNTYTVEISFSYDLNDGNGTQNGVYRKDVKTLKRDDITVAYKNMRALTDSIKFDYEIADQDGLMRITKIELFDAQGNLVKSLDDLSLRTFEGLENESFYTLVTTYEFDLNDGKGVQVDSVSIKYGTSGSKLFINSLSVINNKTPSVGEEVQVRLSLENPHGLQVKAIYISGVRCEVLNNSSDLSDVIVKFIPETEGGHYTVEVTGYEYESGGITLTDDLTSAYKQNIIVMGELNVVDYFAVSDDYYFNFSKTPLRILEIYNPTGYEIYSLTYVRNPDDSTSNKYATTTNFTMIDESHILIKEQGVALWEDIFRDARYCLALCGITYGIEGKKVSSTFDYLDCPVMTYSEQVHISTADDLLSIKGSNNTYYILDNDIDMKGVPWSGVSGKGLFDGQGHTISNLTIVIEDEGTTLEYYGLFKSFIGVIHDVHLENIYYSVKTESSNLSVAGISASGSIVYNSSVSGTIRVQANGGYVAGIANGFVSMQETYRHLVSTNNYVENLKIYVSDGVGASLLNHSNTERRYDVGNARSYDYYYSANEVNSMILGDSFVQNTATNAISYPCYLNDISGAGAMYVNKQLHNVEYTFVTNCDTIPDFTKTGVSVTSVDVSREGYTVSWYDNPDCTGKEIVLPYMKEENTTLYAKWNRIGLADPRYTYRENWIYNEETRTNVKTYMIVDFGTAEEMDKTFVIGGYYKGYPVVGVQEDAFYFLRYKEVDGNRVDRPWDEVMALCAGYSVYITSTVYSDYVGNIFASNVYFESINKTSKNTNSYMGFNGNNITLHVAAENANYYRQQYGNNYNYSIQTFTAADSPFKDVVNYAETNEKNDRISAICAEADNLKLSTQYPLAELPYNYYEKDGYRWLDYSGTQFVIINNNLYAGIDSIVEDELFRYIIYVNGDVTIDAFLAPSTATVDLTTLPYKITAIADGVFRDSKLKNITLNEGLREIGAYAFYNCVQLKAIEYPSSLRSVGSHAFYNCNNLQKIVMNDAITKIEECTFAENSAIKEIVWSKNLKEIGYNAFTSVRTGIDFILPEGLEKISYSAFWNCDLNIYLPASVKTIENYAIHLLGQYNIYVASDKKLSGWGDNWLDGTYTTIYWDVKEIKANQDYKYLVTNKGEVIVIKCINNKLTSVEFDFEEVEVTEIAKYAFSGVNLSELVLPESLKIIGSDAFFYTSNLKYVLIPAGVEEIGRSAFAPQTCIYSMANKAGAVWDDEIADRTVFGCIGVEQNEDFVYVKEINGAHIVGLAKAYTKMEIDFKIEGCPTLSIANELFRNNRFLTSVVIPEGVEKIGDYAFTSCYNIQELSLPSTLVSVGRQAFENCGNSTVYLPISLTTVGEGAFAGSLNLACAAKEKPEGWSDRWFGWNDNFNLYDSRIYWDIAEMHVDGTETYNYLVKNSGGIILLGTNDTSITEIDFTAFDGDVVEIGYSAFSGCYSIIGVVLPQTVTAVRQSAFNVWNIKYVYVPLSVVGIGQCAFSDNSTVLTARTEFVEGWDTNVWTKAVKGVTDWRIETTNGTYLVYTVSGESEEKRVSIY